MFPPGGAFWVYEGLGGLQQGMRNGGSPTRGQFMEEKGVGLKEEALGARGGLGYAAGEVRCSEGLHRGGTERAGGPSLCSYYQGSPHPEDTADNPG